MNNVDINKIAEAIATLLDQFGVAVDNASVDLVPYLQALGDKIVAYKAGISWMWIWVGIAVGVLGLFLFIVGCIRDWDEWTWVILIAGILIAALIIVPNVQTLIACKTFEEKVILDYIESIMNSANQSR